MSDLTAKYHALHLLQKLASGERTHTPGGGRGSMSPRKPGIRSSDDILKEKYTELAELMAVQHLEQRAVSALQKMYLSPRKGEGKPRASRRKKDGGRSKGSQERKDSFEGEKKQRPQSASSNSSFSSHSSVRSSCSRSSAMSNSSGLSSASRASSMSSSSRTSSRSNSSRASTKSNSSRASSKSDSSRSSTRSRSPKPIERHFVTIVEEEEEEEVVNQDAIKDRQVVRFDDELAKENEEEARLKREASKRTRHVSFVLEAAEQTSDEDNSDEGSASDDTLKNEERFVPGQEDDTESHDASKDNYETNHDDKSYEDERFGRSEHRSKYIEIENSFLREILSPRSPRRMAKLSPPRSEERSTQRRRKSKSPVRSARNASPKRAWDLFDTLPPRPKRDVSPCDHKLSNTDDPDIKRWLRHKNALLRRQRKAELRKEREERRSTEAHDRQQLAKHKEAEHLYDSWLEEKKKTIRKQHKMERITAKEEKKREQEEFTRRSELFKEKQKTPRTEKKSKRKSKSKKGSTNFDGEGQNAESRRDGKRNFPSSNPFKGLSYDQWMRQKLEQEESRKKSAKSKRNTDPDLEDIIPNIAKDRIQRATGGKGKRVDSGLRQSRHDLPECDRPAEKKTELSKPYTRKQDDSSRNSTSTQKATCNQEGGQRKTGLQRPSTAQNRVSGGRRRTGVQSQSTSSEKARPPHNQRVFSPTSVRPEPYGSESNDDHSEHSARVGGLKNKQKPSGMDMNSNIHEDGSIHKVLVKRETMDNSNIIDPGDLSVFMTEPVS